VILIDEVDKMGMRSSQAGELIINNKIKNDLSRLEQQSNLVEFWS
jgi:hypothetical protein